MTACCPTCGHEIADAIEMEGLIDAFSMTQRKIITCLVESYPRSVTKERLIDYIYFDDPTGGPDNPHNLISVMLHRMRPTLNELGWEVPRGKCGPNSYALYRLRRIDAE